MIDGLPEHTYYLFFNERKDLISLDVYHFKQFVVIASICEDVEPFRDFLNPNKSMYTVRGKKSDNLKLPYPKNCLCINRFVKVLLPHGS